MSSISTMTELRGGSLLTRVASAETSAACSWAEFI